MNIFYLVIFIFCFTIRFNVFSLEIDNTCLSPKTFINSKNGSLKDILLNYDDGKMILSDIASTCTPVNPEVFYDKSRNKFLPFRMFHGEDNETYDNFAFRGANYTSIELFNILTSEGLKIDKTDYQTIFFSNDFKSAAIHSNSGDDLDKIFRTVTIIPSKSLYLYNKLNKDKIDYSSVQGDGVLQVYNDIPISILKYSDIYVIINGSYYSLAEYLSKKNCKEFLTVISSPADKLDFKDFSSNAACKVSS